MRISRFFAVLMVLFVFNLSAWDEGANSYDSIKARAKNYDVPFIVYIRADWCPWCVKLDGYLAESDFDNIFRGKYTVKITPDSGPAEKKIAKDLGVKGYPTILIIFPNGSKKDLSIPIKSTRDDVLKSLKKQLDAVFKE